MRSKINRHPISYRSEEANQVVQGSTESGVERGRAPICSEGRPWLASVTHARAAGEINKTQSYIIRSPTSLMQSLIWDLREPLEPAEQLKVVVLDHERVGWPQ